MKTHSRSPSPYRRQGGFALVAAIFLMVVLGATAAFLVNITGVQRESNNLSLLSTGAYYAARSGLDWGIYRVVESPGICPSTLGSIGSFSIGIYAVQIDCVGSGDFYQISVLASHGSFGQRDFVSRQLMSTLSTSP